MGPQSMASLALSPRGDPRRRADSSCPGPAPLFPWSALLAVYPTNRVVRHIRKERCFASEEILTHKAEDAAVAPPTAPPPHLAKPQIAPSASLEKTYSKASARSSIVCRAEDGAPATKPGSTDERCG